MYRAQNANARRMIRAHRGRSNNKSGSYNNCESEKYDFDVIEKKIFDMMFELSSKYCLNIIPLSANNVFRLKSRF